MSLLAVTVGAALCADLTWYAVGRWRGVQTLSRLRRHFPIGGEGELPSLHRATAWLNSPP